MKFAYSFFVVFIIYYNNGLLSSLVSVYLSIMQKDFKDNRGGLNEKEIKIYRGFQSTK